MYFWKKGLSHTLYMHPAVLKVTERRSAAPTRLPHALDLVGGPAEGSAQPLNNEPPTLILKKVVRGLAFAQLKNAFLPEHGYIIDVAKIHLDSIQISKILPSSGLIECHVKFEALVLYPVVGEVVLAVVTKVEKGSILITYGDVVQGIVALENFWWLDDYVYKEDLEFEDDVATLTPKFKSLADSAKEIKKGSTVRVKVSMCNPRNGHRDFWLVGSMKDKYLGPVPAKKKDGES